MNSWKTTFAGLLAIAGAVLPFFFPQYAAVIAAGTAAASGAGLLAARDNSKTSEAAGATQAAR